MVEEMKQFNPYQNNTPTTNYYSGFTGSEIDMRQELINMFDGKYPEIGKGQIALLRRMVRDSNNQTKNCNCVDLITKEGDKDRFCPVCYSVGKIWIEEEIQIYSHVSSSMRRKLNTSEQLSPFGLLNVPLIIFYVKYDAVINHGDYIVTLNLDKEGNVIVPKKRKALFYVETLWEYRCDHARSEYWICYTHEANTKYLNGLT